MRKNIRLYTNAVLFGKLPTPKVNHCLHMNIQYLTFDIRSHVISYLGECSYDLEKPQGFETVTSSIDNQPIILFVHLSLFSLTIMG